MRALSVPEGDPVTPLNLDELPRLRALGHATYWDTSKAPSPPVSETTQNPASPHPLILQESDGEHLVRRFLSHLPFTIKVDEQFGNAQDFFVLTETLVPGGTIPFHMHHNAEEILILEEGGATVTVGDKRAVAGPLSIVFIPRETWVSVMNSGTQSIHLYALFSRAKGSSATTVQLVFRRASLSRPSAPTMWLVSAPPATLLSGMLQKAHTRPACRIPKTIRVGLCGSYPSRPDRTISSGLPTRTIRP